jgi:FkbM family methyltransferase
MVDMAISDEKARSLQEEFFGNNVREQAVLNCLRSLLPGYNRFIDVGANIGQYSYFANKWLSNAEIICVEANPALLNLLTATINLSKAEDDNNNSFRTINNVVSDCKEELTFYIDETTTTTSSIFPNNKTLKFSDRPAIHVSSITLDEFYNATKRTLIKMDIEGAEYRALRASKLFLASADTTFLIEVHPWGDPERRRYPLHLAAIMFLNRYAMRKVVPHYFFGSHYVFTKSTLCRRSASFIYYLPVLFIEFIVYRFFQKDAEKITGVLRALFKRANNRFPSS